MHTPSEIIKMVDKMELSRADLHSRQDGDFDRYNLVPYKGETDEDGNAVLDGYKKFTANDPRTSMNLALHLLNTAPAIIRVRKPKAQKQERENDNMVELWAIGILRQANERRADLMMPDLKDALDAQCLFRGGTAERVLLIKEDIEPDDDIVQMGQELEGFSPADREEIRKILKTPQTRTFVDIQDWDPRNTYYGLGPNGIKDGWACHKVMRSAAEIKTEWDVDFDSDDPEKEFAVYDYFDDEHNLVVMDQERELKPKTKHGMGSVPVDIHLVGGIPFFQAEGHDYDVNYGESFYQSDREIYDQQNFILSVLAELSSRSIKQGLKVFSADGELSLENDIRESGAEVSLKKDTEDIVPMPPMEMIQSSSAFMGVVSQMAQRGTFPSSAFGELAFQLSGFAITQLRQGLEAPLTPSIKTVTIAMRGILRILSTAYSSGNFDTMTLSGRMQDVGRTDFEEEIPIETIRTGGVIEVEILPQLPQDDQSKAALAQMYAQGDVPLADHRFIREKILNIQDVEQVERAVQEQLAKTGSPVALAFANMMAAAEQEDMELATIWYEELQLQMMERLLQMTQLKMASQQLGVQGGGGPQGGGQGGGGNGRGSRPSPAQSPPAIQGIPPPSPTPQAGPIAAPGTPRPSRQSAGLVG